MRDNENKLKQERFRLDIKKKLPAWGQSGSGTGCPEMMCSLYSWRFSTSIGWSHEQPGLASELTELWAGGWTRGTFWGPSQPESSCDPVCSLQPGYLKSVFAFSEFWSQLNSGIESSTVRKSCGVVLSLSALRSEHYDKEHGAGGDSFKPPVQSSLFSQATIWQAIPLFFSLEEMRQAD